MKVVSIGDLVLDYYYKNGRLLGVNGGMSSHNIIANLSKLKINTSVFGVCGNDAQGRIAIKSLENLGVDISNIEILDNIRTRNFHVSYFLDEKNNLTFTSKKRCPFCNKKEWYEDSKLNITNISDTLEEDDILVFDNLNLKNQYIIDNTSNKKMLDLGQYFEFEDITDEEIISKLNNKFDIINLNERVEKYILKRFNINSLIDVYNLISCKLVIVTRGKKGADFVYNNQIIHHELTNLSEEVDSTGAGDAFFSVYIAEYIKKRFDIDLEFIENTFIKATNLTSKVVKKMGARGHINSLYKIKAIKECTCKEFEVQARKQIKRCNININHLKSRVINAINSKAYDKLNDIEFEQINNCLFIGTGGSLAGANFASKVINNLYGINAMNILPRDVLYRNNKHVDKVFMFSYSGTTNDLIVGTNDIENDKKYIITKGEQQKVVLKTGINKNNIISYRTSSNSSKERGFLAFEGVVSPASLFLKYYIEKSNLNIDTEQFINDSIDYWNKYIENYFKINKSKLQEILKTNKIINVFTGDYTSSASIDLESKIIESGIFNILIHEKKNFSHGRFINYENLGEKIGIYFKQKETSKYEEELLKYLNKENLIVFESKYNGILCEYDLLIASQYLIYYISNFLNIDISKPTYSEDAMKIYFYKGNL